MKEIHIYNNLLDHNYTLFDNNELPILPDIILGDFTCVGCDLTTLKNCPKEVHGNFICKGNFLKTLKYCPEYVEHSFFCSINKLTNLKYCPKNIGNHFDCSYNLLSNLKYFPEYIEGSIILTNNKLTCLKGIQKVVNNYLWINDNELTTLKGGPEFVKRLLDCSNNKLTSLKHGTKKVGIEKFKHYDKAILDKQVSIYLRHTNNENDLSAEASMIIKGYDNYYSDLFDHCKNYNYPLPNIKWDKKFLNTLSEDEKNYLYSGIGISKFGL